APSDETIRTVRGLVRDGGLDAGDSENTWSVAGTLLVIGFPPATTVSEGPTRAPVPQSGAERCRPGLCPRFYGPPRSAVADARGGPTCARSAAQALRGRSPTVHLFCRASRPQHEFMTVTERISADERARVAEVVERLQGK